MRPSESLISTFFFLLLSSLSFLVPSADALRHRHVSKPEHAIVVARQYHPRTLVSRDLINSCISLDADLNVLPPSVKALLVGQAEVCLCLKDLDIFLDAKVKGLGVLGNLINVPGLRVLLNDLLHTKGSQCTVPSHAHLACTNANPCHFECDDGFTRVGNQCVCSPPKELCNGQCLASPNVCGPSPIPRYPKSRRGEITTLKAAQELCQGRQVCGVPSSNSKYTFECIDVTTTTDSCGGCVHPHPWARTSATAGKDCSALSSDSVLQFSCRNSRCVVGTCRPGFKPSLTDDDDCVTVGHVVRAVDNSGPTDIDLNTLSPNVVTTSGLGNGLNSAVNDAGVALTPALIRSVDPKGTAPAHASCSPSPPALPATSPNTIGGLVELVANLLDLGKDLDGLVGLLDSDCNCHNAPASPSFDDPASLVKAVIDLTIKLTVKLGLLQSDPSNVSSLESLAHQLLDASKQCLDSTVLELGLKGLIQQTVDLTNHLLGGLRLLPRGVDACGCKAELVKSLVNGVSLRKRAYSLRRGEPCIYGEAPLHGLSLVVDAKVNLRRRGDAAPVEVDLNPLGIDSVIRVDAGSLNPTINQLGEPVAPTIIHPVDQAKSSCPVSASPPATPPTTLDDLVGLVNHLLDQLLGVIHLGDLLGDQCGCRDAPSSPTDVLVKVVVDLVLKLDGSPAGLQADPTDVAGLDSRLNEILTAANKCLGADDLDPLLNSLIQQVVDLVNKLIAGLKLVPPGAGQCGCKSDLVSSLVGSLLTRRADPCIVGGTSSGVGYPNGPASGDSGASANSPGSGVADPSNAVDVDLNCLGLNGDVIVNLGSELNSVLNGLLNPLSGPLVHPEGISPCKPKSSTGVPPDSASSIPTSPLTTASTSISSPTSTSSPSTSSGGSKTGTDSGADGSVVVDLKCLGLGGSEGENEIVTDLKSLNTVLNSLLDPLKPVLTPLVHPGRVEPCIKPAAPGSGPSSTPTMPTSSSIPGNVSNGQCEACKGSSPAAAADPSKPVLVDLNPIIDLKATVDAGPQLNTLLNNLLDPLLSPIVQLDDSRSGPTSSPSGSLVSPALVANLHTVLSLSSTMADTAKELYSSCGCGSDPTSPVLAVVALTAKLEDHLQVMKTDPTVTSVSVVLELVHGLLAASKACSEAPSLTPNIVASVSAMIGNCNHLTASLGSLLEALKACGCSKDLAASLSTSASGSVARSKMLRKRHN
ncbi:hypothetical protein WG66_001977 [Moniliophthora roreri]|uniref:Protein CPL1-like domain-containing protein n=1 Tax=Moniliophthora roreri TaxID=221103 RepID=A0A0W0FSW2_MONRR|nr:hypothetical protein WG66_001977 [Moniliophthora roreri]